MKRSPTISIAQLKRSAVWAKNKHLFKKSKSKNLGGGKIGGKIVSKVYPQSSREKFFIETTLFEFCQKIAVPLYAEYRFTEERRWRIDWFFEIKEKRFGIEYEGLNSRKSRHTTKIGFSNDTDKYRYAAMAGITILRYTAFNYSKIVDDLKNI